MLKKVNTVDKDFLFANGYCFGGLILAQHFDYGRNLVVIDLLAVKQSHCGFMILLCDEAERTRVENSKVVAVDGSTNHSNAIPTGGTTH